MIDTSTINIVDETRSTNNVTLGMNPSPKLIQKIALPVINPCNDPQILLFNLDDIKILRNTHHVLGMLIGTLPQFPQQNLFLAIPLKLNIYETLWLIKLGQAMLIDQMAYRLAKVRDFNNASLNANVEGSLITTANTDYTTYDYELAQQHEIDVKQYLTSYLASNTYMSTDTLLRNFHYYAFLQSQGYFINPGLKFGGDLVLYPGDPLRFHSYSIVKFDFVDMYEIILGGRLATSVKKNLVLMGLRRNMNKIGETKKDTIGVPNEKEENTSMVNVDDKFIENLFEDEVPLCFSIEWAGFG